MIKKSNAQELIVSFIVCFYNNMFSLVDVGFSFFMNGKLIVGGYYFET